MTKYASTLFVAAFAATAFVPPALAQSVQLQTNIVATGLERPVFATAPSGDSRLFIVEQGGLIKILQNGSVLSTPFLNLSGSVSTEGERGLVGMAFDPNFASNHRFYVNYIDKTSRDTVVATYEVDPARPNVADAASRQTIITIDQPEGSSSHKAGWMGFRQGEPANLYIASGDGGVNTNGQNLSSNLGKILRVDVSLDRFPGDSSQYGYAIPGGNLDTGNPEIYAFGLRNPFRASFDSENGTFYIADVGDTVREEVNIGAAGANFGWRKFEGTLEIFPNDPQIANHTAPIFEYNHGAKGGAVIGGYVYHGSDIPGLEGTYFFADFVSDTVTSFRLTDSGVTDLTDRTAELLSPTGISGNVTSFGEDASGNLYLVSLNGQVGMITAIPEPQSLAMMVAGIALIGIWVRRRGKATTLAV
jgi:glucose/arabinose dehydrogenase